MNSQLAIVNDSPLISVITVCRNAEDLIVGTIESVISQKTDFMVEYVVIDGFSTDNTLFLIESYGFLISKLLSEPDDGISDAMNKGVSLSSGKLIIHLNAGDSFVDNGVLSRIGASFLKDRWSWAVGSTIFVNSKREIVTRKKIEVFDRKGLYLYNFICHQSAVVSRQAYLDAGGLAKDLKYAMDYELWIKLSKISDAHVLPFEISNYLVGGVSRDARKLLVEFKAIRMRNLSRSKTSMLVGEGKSWFWYLVADSPQVYRIKAMFPKALTRSIRHGIQYLVFNKKVD